MNDKNRSRWDELIDLLAEQVAERIEAKSARARALPEPPLNAPNPIVMAEPKPIVPEPEEEPMPNLASQNARAASLMTRLALGVLLVIVLINIPFNSQGIALARSIPTSAALVIANGLLVKEESSPDVYLYRENAFHWITSLDAFEHYGYRWQSVHIVEPGFLNTFDKGAPLYVLLKCVNSPHIYRLENGLKRWIVDIPTFTAEGYVWNDVKFVPCNYLRNLQDGESIPPGRGSPPPPLP